MPGFPLPIVRTVSELRARVRDWRSHGETVGLVPTMGALHDGHLSLIRRSKQSAAKAVASIFVNPSQFGPNEDFHAYPRDEARDAELLASVGCDLLYAPDVGQMYPEGFCTTVIVGGVSEPLEGIARPGHLAGVATVVAKLLIQAAPDIAVFGEKDYQQLQLIRRLVRDLDLPVEIVGAPTIRAQDGLARSSRNAYLSEDERAVAGRLNVILVQTAKVLADGGRVDQAEAEARAALLGVGFARVDYVEARASEGLARRGPGPIDGPTRLLAAAWIGRTRLIDNIEV